MMAELHSFLRTPGMSPFLSSFRPVVEFSTWLQGGDPHFLAAVSKGFFSWGPSTLLLMLSRWCPFSSELSPFYASDLLISFLLHLSCLLLAKKFCSLRHACFMGPCFCLPQYCPKKYNKQNDIEISYQAVTMSLDSTILFL